ncbi:MAG: biotin--[acetyl-CoA-carboxylase] ligase [Hoeflea sp.]|uniref:biotin--[acetyl-CoA-carboxylase] ligase n=1 Tax=Hoeflea sp. TaxID=1940281 RepID=UPI000C1141F8|nr:biotin--[acetyl-CoA-carboxylase] ligase [Hoeflea sp.]PHR19624.1 MAG: biotin--[acetyl-CoA-carboxylase] ligase [Hoeflea sp.]
MRDPEFRHIALGDVASTNAECMERARAGDAGGLWITATRQTFGRGRRGRTWVSEPGNLYSSLLLIDPGPQKALASLPLAVTVAVHDAVAAALPDEARGLLNIKWPNDLLIDGHKTSGILIEAEQLADGRRAVVIGCGINVAHRPDTGLYPSTCLADQGSAITPQELFARLVVSMDSVLKDWDEGRGLAQVRQAWIDRAEGIGKPVTVNLPDRQIHGLFDGIDDEGRLMLAMPDGETQMIASGDVFFA